MKRASYREAVRWIANNDEPECMDAEDMETMISVLLIADIFAVEPRRVADDVIRIRSKQLK